MLAHAGGVMVSTFSLRYLASFWMSADAGMSLGVNKIVGPLGFFLQ
jgi:hypothetical protein